MPWAICVHTITTPTQLLEYTIPSLLLLLLLLQWKSMFCVMVLTCVLVLARVMVLACVMV